MSVSRKLSMDAVHQPTTGLLGEVYRILSSVQFNAASQRQILEQIQQDSTTESLGLPLIEVIQQRENSYLLCGNLRHYQLLRAAGAKTLHAHILPAETSPNSYAVRALRQGISTILMYDCTTKAPHPQLRELKKYLKNHASHELLELIKNDAFLKDALSISARDLRTQLQKKSPLELMVKQLKIST